MEISETIIINHEVLFLSHKLTGGIAIWRKAVLE